MTCAVVETRCKHVNAAKAFYSDWTAELAQSGLTLTSAVVTFPDTSLTVGTVTVTDSTITDKDDDGNTITIAAGKAFKFELSGGTAIADTDDPIEGKIIATFSDSSTDARILKLRVYA